MTSNKICLKGAKHLFLQEMGKTEESFEKDVDIVEEWLKTQKHLPEITSRNRIATFLMINKCSIEIVKKKIDMYYSVRKIVPEFFSNKHPRLAHMKKLSEILYFVVLPKLTKEGNRVIIYKLRNPELFKKIDYYDFLAHTMNILEIRIAEEECISDVYFFDLAGFVLADLVKCTPSMLKKMSFVLEGVYSNRIAALNFLNAPVLEALLKVVKLFLNPKLVSRINIFKETSDIFEKVPQEIFPKDYGGNEVSLSDLSELWNTKLVEYYERFDALAKMEVNEELRPAPLENDDVLGFHGNFKKLDVD